MKKLKEGQGAPSGPWGGGTSLAGPNVLAVGDSNLRVLGLQWSQIVTDRHRSQFDAVCVFLLCEFMRSKFEFAQFAPRLLPMQKCPLR